MNAQWIDDPAALRQFCRDELGEGPVAVDTESDHFHAYQAQVCLIQLATDDAAALVDPLAIDAEELAPLFDVFEDPSITKVLHSARNDLNELDRDYGIDVKNLFDTQIAVRFLGYERNSLDWMLEHLLGVDPGGSYSRYDWTTRPLSDDARRYAVDDVRHLLELRDRFVDELDRDGWMTAFRQQCRYIAEITEFRASDFEPDGWRDLDGISEFDAAQRAVLHQLYDWRHRLCARRNQSAVTIFPNRPLVEIARHRPMTRDELADIAGIPESLVADCSDEILEVVADADPASAPPVDRPTTTNEPPPPRQRKCYQALRKWRNETAESLDIPTEFIATNATLSTIADRRPQDDAELAGFDAVLDWHIEVLGDELLEIIDRV